MIKLKLEKQDTYHHFFKYFVEVLKTLFLEFMKYSLLHKK